MPPNPPQNAIVARLCDFFVVATQTILYVHSVYPRHTFEAREKYNVPVYVSRSPLLTDYVHHVVASFRDWLEQDLVNSVVVALRSEKSSTVVARYIFDVAVMPLDASGNAVAVLSALDAQFRSHILRLCAGSDADGAPSADGSNGEALAFDVVLYTKGVRPSREWMEASEREARVIHGGSAAVPLKDADGANCTVQIASRVEVPFA